jgi:hypothetical protein
LTGGGETGIIAGLITHRILIGSRHLSLRINSGSLTLSALSGNSLITDAAVCRHHLHLLNEAGSGTDNFLVPQSSCTALQGRDPTEPVWMLDAGNLIASL